MAISHNKKSINNLNKSTSSIGIPSIFFKNKSILNFNQLTSSPKLTNSQRPESVWTKLKPSIYGEKLSNRVKKAILPDQSYLDEQKFQAVKIIESKKRKFLETPEFSQQTKRSYVPESNHNLDNVSKKLCQSTNANSAVFPKTIPKGLVGPPNYRFTRAIDKEYTLRDESFLLNPYLFEPIKTVKSLNKVSMNESVDNANILKEREVEFEKIKQSVHSDNVDNKVINLKLTNVENLPVIQYKTKSISQLLSEIDNHRLATSKNKKLSSCRNFNQRFENIKNLLCDVTPSNENKGYLNEKNVVKPTFGIGNLPPNNSQVTSEQVGMFTPSKGVTSGESQCQPVVHSSFEFSKDKNSDTVDNTKSECAQISTESVSKPHESEIKNDARANVQSGLHFKPHQGSSDKPASVAFASSTKLETKVDNNSFTFQKSESNQTTSTSSTNTASSNIVSGFSFDNNLSTQNKAIFGDSSNKAVPSDNSMKLNLDKCENKKSAPSVLSQGLKTDSSSTLNKVDFSSKEANVSAAGPLFNLPSSSNTFQINSQSTNFSTKPLIANPGSFSVPFTSQNAPGQTSGTPSSFVSLSVTSSSNIFGQSVASPTNIFCPSVATSINSSGQSVTSSSKSFGQNVSTSNNIYGQSVTLSNNTFGQSATSSNNMSGQSVISSNTMFGQSVPSNNGPGLAVTSSNTMFGQSVTSNNGFGLDVTSSNSKFGQAVISSTTLFGKSVTSSNNGFVSSVTSSNSLFGQSVTSSNNGFGSSVASSNSLFGQSVTSSNNGFGSAVTLSNNAFGPSDSSSNNAFGQTATLSNNTFGPSVTSSNNAFGQTITSPSNFFGQTISNAPQSSSGSAFGQTMSTPKNTFGQTVGTISNTFGQATNNASTIFGQSVPISVNTFNTPTTFSQSVSGSSIAFGQSASGTSSGTFGQPTSSMFGQAVSTSSNIFGQSENTFGKSGNMSKSIFGQTVNTTNDLFHQTVTTTANSFGAANRTSSTFHGPNNLLGQSNSTPAGSQGQLPGSNLFGQSNSGTVNIFGQNPNASASPFGQSLNTPTNGTDKSITAEPVLFGATPISANTFDKRSTESNLFGQSNASLTKSAESNMFGNINGQRPNETSTVFRQSTSTNSTGFVFDNAFVQPPSVPNSSGFTFESKKSSVNIFNQSTPTSYPFGKTENNMNSEKPLFGQSSASDSQKPEIQPFGQRKTDLNTGSSVFGQNDNKNIVFGQVPNTNSNILATTTKNIFSDSNKFGQNSQTANNLNFDFNSTNKAFANSVGQNTFGQSSDSSKPPNSQHSTPNSNAFAFNSLGTSFSGQSNGGFNFGQSQIPQSDYSAPQTFRSNMRRSARRR